MSEDRIVLPDTTFMRRGGEAVWHLGPQWAPQARDHEARCGATGRFVFFQSGLPADAQTCGACYDQAGLVHPHREDRCCMAHRHHAKMMHVGGGCILR